MRDWFRIAVDRGQVLISRLVNIATGGDWELFCTRVIRNKWTRTAAVLDAIHHARTGVDRHCRRAYAWDRRHNRRPK